MLSISRISALWMCLHTTPSQPQRRASSVITFFDVGGVAEIGELLGVLDHAVEQVAVHDPKALARERRVERFAAHVNIAEREIAELVRGFVVIAGDIHDLRALRRIFCATSLCACGQN